MSNRSIPMSPVASDVLSFKTIVVSGQSDIVADSSTDTLTIVAGTNVTITTDASTDTITINAAAESQSVFRSISVSGQSDVVADTTTDTLTLVAGSGITITTNATTDTITISASGSGLSDGDKGDVTVSSSGSVWTIDNQAVTYAKIQDVSATDKLLGRVTSGSGVIEEITCTAAARSILDDTTVSAILDTLGGASAQGTGGVVRETSPTITTPTISGGTITGITDLAVADGGTGVSSLTQYGVVLGNGSSAFGVTAAGASGKVLTGNGSANPTFQGVQETWAIAISDDATAITTGTAKGVPLRIPYAFTVTEVSLSVKSSTGTITVDVNEDGVTILSTKITLDSTELTTSTAATPAVISDSSVAASAEITADVDAVTGTVKGAVLYIKGYRT